jgi:hypothetical protein
MKLPPTDWKTERKTEKRKKKNGSADHDIKKNDRDNTVIFRTQILAFHWPKP